MSNVDPSQMTSVLASIDPSETLFVLASKTFPAAETLANAANGR